MSHRINTSGGVAKTVKISFLRKASVEAIFDLWKAHWVRQKREKVTLPGQFIYQSAYANMLPFALKKNPFPNKLLKRSVAYTRVKI